MAIYTRPITSYWMIWIWVKSQKTGLLGKRHFLKYFLLNYFYCNYSLSKIKVRPRHQWRQKCPIQFPYYIYSYISISTWRDNLLYQVFLRSIHTQELCTGLLTHVTLSRHCGELSHHKRAQDWVSMSLSVELSSYFAK